MADPKLRVCPTRIDGTPVLVAHKVDGTKCQARQRERYHKCFTCAWNNSYVASHGEPVVTPPSEQVGVEAEATATT
jgi:hypothetical protein